MRTKNVRLPKSSVSVDLNPHQTHAVPSLLTSVSSRPPTVDCWDGQDGEPIVHHGYTLTSKILFKDVIETINKYAFVKNE